ncbi:MAG: hypothetical protein DRI88_06815 [Bacteroidetes bacterium]|nr:MAG: hypothetical protein DRI88_06815 [Bacteroidota bacterium]
MKSEKRNYDLMHKNPSNWRGVFYFNRKDPRITVPKSDPTMGWTINFGNPYTYVLLFLIILILTATALFL